MIDMKDHYSPSLTGGKGGSTKVKKGEKVPGGELQQADSQGPLAKWSGCRRKHGGQA